MSFFGSTTLGVGIFEVILVVMGDFLSFSWFLVKPVNFDCVFRAVVIVEDVVKLEEVREGVSEEKMLIFGEIFLVDPIFDVFLFPGSTRSCDVETRA